MSDLVEVGGLWKNDGKKGMYLGGYLGKARLFVFPNPNKDRHDPEDKTPDYWIKIGPGKEQTEYEKNRPTDTPNTSGPPNSPQGNDQGRTLSGTEVADRVYGKGDPDGDLPF